MFSILIYILISYILLISIVSPHHSVTCQYNLHTNPITVTCLSAIKHTQISRRSFLRPSRQKSIANCHFFNIIIYTWGWSVYNGLCYTYLLVYWFIRWSRVCPLNEFRTIHTSLMNLLARYFTPTLAIISNLRPLDHQARPHKLKLPTDLLIIHLITCVYYMKIFNNVCFLRLVHTLPCFLQSEPSKICTFFPDTRMIFPTIRSERVYRTLWIFS